MFMTVLQMLRHLLLKRKKQFWWRWVLSVDVGTVRVCVCVCVSSAILNTSFNYIWIKYFKEESVQPDGNGIYLVWLVIDIVWCVDSLQHLRMRIQLYKWQKSNPGLSTATHLGSLWANMCRLYVLTVSLCTFLNIFTFFLSLPRNIIIPVMRKMRKIPKLIPQ